MRIRRVTYRARWRRVVDKVRTIIEDDHTTFSVFAQTTLSKAFANV